MGTPLKNPPVYFTLAQVRFNPILQLAQFLPSIQEKFRLASFPDFEQHHVVSIELSLTEGQQQPKLVPQERYQFGNTEKTHVFIVDAQSITLQSTNYGCFEDFSGGFLTGLDIVHSVVGLAFVDRIGLRYVDRVMPKPDESIDLYLAPQCHGMSSQLGGSPIHSYTESFNEIGSVRLRSRVLIQNGPIAFPSDLQPGNMRISDRFADYTGISAILDNDGSIEARQEFDRAKLAAELDMIHKVIGAAFKATATAHARTVWDS